MKKAFKSIYLRGILGVTVLIIIAQTITFLFIYFGFFPKELNSYDGVLSVGEIKIFAGGAKLAVLIGAIIGSIFVVTGAVAFLVPIKKVISATKEVAKGNFNVEVQVKSHDEIQELVDNFNLMVKELGKNEYLRKDFIASVSHEFKTPITSIEGFAKLLKTENLSPEKYSEYADIIIKESQRLVGLSSNLLKIGVLDSSEFEPVKKTYLLDEQLRRAVLLFEKQWSEKQIEMELDLEKLVINANEDLIYQVWLNLIENAIKFSKHGGKIEISAEIQQNIVVVKISDNGIGIPEEELTKIFDRFYKVEKSRTTVGSGLGLSLVKKIIDISKGSIECESKPDSGTSFTVRLPL